LTTFPTGFPEVFPLEEVEGGGGGFSLDCHIFNFWI
jgi:hypothetical protein